MASLSEMLAYAEAKQPRSRVAETLNSAVKGGFGGFLQQKEENSKQIDRLAKAVEIEQKIRDMQMQDNFAKFLGLTPHSTEELAAARDVAFEHLGTGKTGIQVKDRTKSGALQSFYNPNAEEMTKSWSSKGGFSVSVRPKKERTGKNGRTDSQERARRSGIESLATKFAERFQVMSLKNQGRKDEEIGQLMMGWKPSPDEWKKYLPLAEQYYDGDRASFDEMYERTRKDDDPESLFDGEEE